MTRQVKIYFGEGEILIMESPSTIFENLLFTTVRIATKDSIGDESTGTGFIYSHKIDDANSQLFLITCWHVIEGAKEGVFHFHRSNNKNGFVLGDFYWVKLDDFEKKWTKHPIYDLALFPLGRLYNSLEKSGTQTFFRPLNQDMIPTPDRVNEEIDAIEDVYFLGYPNDIYDKKNLIPVVRKGNTATPISIDFEGEPKFLVDASIFPGSSGSPVLICNVGSYRSKKGNIVFGNRIFFLGILAEVYLYQDVNDVKVIEIPTKKKLQVETSQMMDLGVVFKSSLVKEMIEDFINKNP